MNRFATGIILSLLVVLGCIGGCSSTSDPMSDDIQTEIDSDSDTDSVSIPVLTTHITDLSQVDIIVQAGSAAGGVVKPHSFIHLNSSASQVPVYSPIDATLHSAVYYTQSGTELYIITLTINENFTLYFDHLKTVSDKIGALLPDTPQSDTRSQPISEVISISAGEQVGTVGGELSQIWDFGFLNKTQQANVASPNRHSEKLNHMDCGYDYFTDDLKAEHLGKIGYYIKSDPFYPDDITCRKPGPYVAGTPAGMWYRVGSDPTGDYGETLAIADELNHQVVISGIQGSHIRATTGTNSSYLHPSQITTSHTYLNDADGNNLYVMLNMVSETEMDVFIGSGNPATELPPEQAVRYER